jgi:hypothetical protein
VAEKRNLPEAICDKNWQTLFDKQFAIFGMNNRWSSHTLHRIRKTGQTRNPTQNDETHCFYIAFILRWFSAT